MWWVGVGGGIFGGGGGGGGVFGGCAAYQVGEVGGRMKDEG